MNIIRKIWQRVYMFIFYKAAALLPWRQPELIKGNGAMLEIPKKIKEIGLDNCFLVLDPGLVKLGLTDPLVEEFKKTGLQYQIFTKLEPNPKICDIEEGVKLYNSSNSKCICVIGGGSAMDTAKAIGARVVNPKKSIEKMGGLFKVGKTIPTLFAIPTTAGTGSETTIASVVTNEVTHHKYAINDLHLIPKYAVLDPKITAGLPKSITSSTGMDALTHAVEGYLSGDVPKKYRLLAEEAVKLIFDNILEAYNNGSNLEARENMLHASFNAGVVFTRVGLTYVHPLAHALGGLYGIPHGLANATILPICLKYYGKSVYKKLARLADITSITNDKMTTMEKAEAFISKIDEFNSKMNIIEDFKAKISDKKITDDDINLMTNWAYKEANGAYYPPVLLGKDEIKMLFNKIISIK